MVKRYIIDKITTRDKLATKVSNWRESGKVVGFTSGSFDIVHAGHVLFLEKAKEKCDILIVAVNSDDSIQKYKGKDRPIVIEEARMKTIAALESVDYVFSFSERRNRKNLEKIKPTLYIKAGDYKVSELTSADVVKEYGGDILILPLENDYSTTNIINKIKGDTEQSDKTIKADTEIRERRKAVILDRDGTINEEVEYLHDPQKFKLIPNAGEGIKKMQEMGYAIVIVTKQAGIGIGYFTEEDFYKVNREMFAQLKSYNVVIDKIYFAIHGKTPDGKNPKEDLIERARLELDLDLSESFVVGDKTGDLAAGKKFGCKGIAVKTGHGFTDNEYIVKPEFIANNLLDAADWIEKNK